MASGRVSVRRKKIVYLFRIRRPNGRTIDDMSPGNASYMKTSLAAAIAGAIVLVLVILVAHSQMGMTKAFIEGVGSLIVIAGACIALGGLVVLYRSARLARGLPDLFLRLNASRELKAVSSGKPGWGIRVRRLFRRAFGGSHPLVGDMMQVRPLHEIEATLDQSGGLEGLPFMQEMAQFCDQRFRVYRCVDKIFDYGRSYRLRRIKDVVLLAALRCDGTAHGGCQASCYLLWKTAWLRPVDDQVAPGRVTGPSAMPMGSAGRPAQSRYTCQFTQLSAASRPMSRWDLRQDLKPLLSGNLTVAAFCVGMLTRVFSKIDRLRGGTGYPPLSPSNQKKTPLLTYGLGPGDSVRVIGSERIAATLDTTRRNRGLWFDQEMLKHCGQRYRVSNRVERLIDISTGGMLEMKTPCLVLEGVDSSGESMRFWAQHEFLYWREAWLEPETGVPEQGIALVQPPAVDRKV